MSECIGVCLGTEDGHGHLTLTRAKYVNYAVRVRNRGERRMTIIGETRSRRKAFRTLADAIETGKWWRGDVLGDEGRESYYEPSVLVEMKR